MVSVIITTFNRARTVARSIASALAQDYRDLDIIVVDDGSTDETSKIINSFQDARIRVIRHETNKGVCAAKNSGLDNIKGEWFTFLDSDDEMVVPNAVSTLLRTIESVDQDISAITCNCIDATTGNFTGIGVDSDQYIDMRTYIRDLGGDHWGLTRTSLLGEDRFGEFEELLWYKIQKRAKRYYIHKALNIIHTEGSDRVTKSGSTGPSDKRYRAYMAALNDDEYCRDLMKYDPQGYRRLMTRAVLTCIEVGDMANVKKIRESLSKSPNTLTTRAFIALISVLGKKPAHFARSARRFLIRR